MSGSLSGTPRGKQRGPRDKLACFPESAGHTPGGGDPLGAGRRLAPLPNPRASAPRVNRWGAQSEGAGCRSCDPTSGPLEAGRRRSRARPGAAAATSRECSCHLQNFQSGGPALEGGWHGGRQGESASTFAASASRGNPSALQCVGSSIAPGSARGATRRRRRTFEGARGCEFAGTPHNFRRKGTCGGGAGPQGGEAQGLSSGAVGEFTRTGVTGAGCPHSLADRSMSKDRT